MSTRLVVRSIVGSANGANTIFGPLRITQRCNLAYVDFDFAVTVSLTAASGGSAGCILQNTDNPAAVDSQIIAGVRVAVFCATVAGYAFPSVSKFCEMPPGLTLLPGDSFWALIFAGTNMITTGQVTLGMKV